MATALFNARNQSIRENLNLANRFGSPVLHAMDALAISELAPVEVSAAAGGIGQPFRAGLRADIQSVLKATLPTGVAAHQRAF